MIPKSFEQEGFVDPSSVMQVFRLKNGQYLKSLLMGTDGPSDSGKTEFALSAPGPVQVIAVDLNYQGVLDNSSPPPSRCSVFGFKTFNAPTPHPTVKLDPKQFEPYHVAIRDSLYSALLNKESPTVVVDGDSDWAEIHTMSHFGKLTQIYPQTRYAAPKAERKAIMNKAFRSGKIVILTNKSKSEYAPVFDKDGKAVMDEYTSEQKTAPTGKLQAQGFSEKDYLVQIWLHHMYRPATQRQIGNKLVDVPGQWGVRLTKCKHNPAMVGVELWGADCNFKSLVQMVYPEVPLSRWGY